METLEGKVAIITGAARGQGAAEVRLFLSQGCRVVATDIDPPEFELAGGDRLISLYHDISSQANWETVVAETLRVFGRIDILVNNAAIFRLGSFQETTMEEFDLHYRINQAGVFLGMKAVTVEMARSGGGSIINIASVAGTRGAPGAFSYGTSKWAIRGMTKTAARDLAHTGVRVNAIIPGLIETRMMDANSPERNEAIRSSIPMKRPGRPDEVAAAALFLASDASSFMTGSEMTVDGGASG